MHVSVKAGESNTLTMFEQKSITEKALQSNSKSEYTILNTKLNRKIELEVKT